MKYSDEEIKEKARWYLIRKYNLDIEIKELEINANPILDSDYDSFIDGYKTAQYEMEE